MQRYDDDDTDGGGGGDDDGYDDHDHDLYDVFVNFLA